LGFFFFLRMAVEVSFSCVVVLAFEALVDVNVRVETYLLGL
jgi:hypothetical protein